MSAVETERRDCPECGGQMLYTRNRVDGPYEWVHLSGGTPACPAKAVAPLAPHTLTMGDVDDGHVDWKLTCNHDMATWGHYDIETGEYTEADGCWLQSWWGEMGGELLVLRAPIPNQPIPVRPASDWDVDGGTIVLDLGHSFVGVAGHPDDDECTYEGCGRREDEHEWSTR